MSSFTFPWSQSHSLCLVSPIQNDYCAKRDSIFLFFSAPRQEYRDPLLAGFNLFLHSRLAVFSFSSFFFVLDFRR